VVTAKRLDVSTGQQIAGWASWLAWGAATIEAAIHLTSYFVADTDLLLRIALALFGALIIAVVPMAIAMAVFPIRAKDLVRSTPIPVLILGAVVFIYLYAEVSSIFTQLPGQPVVVDGRYYFNIHSSLRPISQAQYLQAVRYELRLWSTGGLAVAALVGLTLRAIAMNDNSRRQGAGRARDGS
jgi:hypothetical protein